MPKSRMTPISFTGSCTCQPRQLSYRTQQRTVFQHPPRKASTGNPLQRPWAPVQPQTQPTLSPSTEFHLPAKGDGIGRASMATFSCVSSASRFVTSGLLARASWANLAASLLFGKSLRSFQLGIGPYWIFSSTSLQSPASPPAATNLQNSVETFLHF